MCEWFYPSAQQGEDLKNYTGDVEKVPFMYIFNGLQGPNLTSSFALDQNLRHMEVNQAMNQVKVIEEDKNFVCFLWSDLVV